MGNRKDIGNVFKERFKDFEQAPSADLWNTIASELDQKSDQKIAPLWLYFGGFLIIGLLTGLLYWAPWDVSDPINLKKLPLVNATQSPIPDVTTNVEPTSNTSSNNASLKTTLEKNISENTTVQTDPSNTSLTTNTASVSSPPQNTNSNNTQIIPTEKNTRRTKNGISNQTSIYTPAQNDKKTTSIVEVLRTMKSASQQAREKKELQAKTAYQAKIKQELATAIAAQKEENKIALQKWQDSILAIEASRKMALAATTKAKDTPEEAKAVKLPKTQEERENDRKEAVNYKFAISPYTSLLTYGSLSKGSSIDNRLVDNPRDAVSTIGYGIRADYKLSEKSSIRFGIGVAPLQYRTDDFQVLITNNNVNIFQLSGIDPQNLSQSAGGGVETSPSALAFFNANDVVSIEQNISYVEVPVDYQYRFLNKRVSMSFNTGLSLFVLTNNRVFATAASGQRIFIGRETSLKDLSLAFNLGLGTYYNFSKNWRFDLEPAFKYQLNPYSENIGNFRPYYFGLQFGMSYKF